MRTTPARLPTASPAIARPGRRFSTAIGTAVGTAIKTRIAVPTGPLRTRTYEVSTAQYRDVPPPTARARPCVRARTIYGAMGNTAVLRGTDGPRAAASTKEQTA